MFGLTPYNRKNNNLAGRNNFIDLRSVFDDFFNDSLFPSALNANAGIRADIRETDKEYVIDAEIPGVNKEDIKLDLRDDVLTISVEHNEEVNEEKDNYIRKERRYGSYSRCFYVENIKNEAVTAKYDKGVLTVTLPKNEEGKSNKRSIDIQ